DRRHQHRLQHRAHRLETSPRHQPTGVLPRGFASTLNSHALVMRLPGQTRFRIQPSARKAAAGLALGLAFLAPADAPAGSVVTPGKTNLIALRDFLQLVIERNEGLHARVLEYEISQKRFHAEKGVFEPELVLSYDRVENDRENTAEQRRSSGVAIFHEK